MSRLTLALGVLLKLSAEYSVVMFGALAGNLSDLTMASSQYDYDILLCSETLVSDMRDVSELLVNGESKVFYGQEPPSGESTTTECGFNYQLLTVIY